MMQIGIQLQLDLNGTNVYFYYLNSVEKQLLMYMLIQCKQNYNCIDTAILNIILINT